MRFFRLIGVLVVMLVAARLGMAQSQPDPGMYAERSGDPKSVHVFPQPAYEYVHIKMEDIRVTNVKLTLHNIIGNQVESETEVVNEHELRVRVKDLAPGYYLIAVRDDDSKFRGTYKFLKR